MLLNNAVHIANSNSKYLPVELNINTCIGESNRGINDYNLHLICFLKVVLILANSVLILANRYQ